MIGHIDCDEETAAVIALHGSPDVRDERIEDGLHIRTFWFHGEGLVVSFTWGADVPCLRVDHPGERTVRRAAR